MGRKSNKINSENKQCIFCGKTPLTKEHFWPSWMGGILKQTYLTLSGKNKHQVETIEFTAYEQNKFIATTNQTNTISGLPESKKYKVVCAECNNGWMSVIDQQASSILPQLILNQNTTIGDAQMKVISKWLYLKFIIRESSKDVQVINKQQRIDFYMTQKVPSSWKMWIGKVDPPNWERYCYRTSVGFSHSVLDHFSNEKSKERHYISGSLTIALGSLVLYAVRSPSYEQQLPSVYEYIISNNYSHKMKMIHPASKSIFSWFKSFRWNKVEPISTQELYALRYDLPQFVRMRSGSITIRDNSL